MADLDTGIGSSVTSRSITRFTTTTGSFPTSTQTVGPTVPDTGTATTVTQRNDTFDEYGRTVTVSSTSTSFTTTPPGPS
jgi:hypothetical protein